MVTPWKVLGSTITYQDPWIKVRSDRCVDGRGREISPFHVLEYPDWVNVVALTPQGEIVLVREYRHGAGEVVLGLPGGIIEPDGEKPSAAARRELVEETGYEGKECIEVGWTHANPSNQKQHCQGLSSTRCPSNLPTQPRPFREYRGAYGKFCVLPSASTIRRSQVPGTTCSCDPFCRGLHLA